MALYRLTWEIDVEADDPKGAALLGHAIMLDPQSISPIFEVRNMDTLQTVEIDLEKEG